MELEGIFFVRVLSLYPNYINQFYTNNKGLESLSYTEQYKRIMYDSYGVSNFLTTELSIRKIPSITIIDNCEPLLKAWAKENSYTYQNNEDVVVEMIQRMKPEVVLFNTFSLTNSEYINLKKKIKSIRKLALFLCSPISKNKAKALKYFDFILTCTEWFEKHIEKQGLKAYQITHAFAQQVNDRIDSKSNSKIDISFSGSIILNQNYHLERADYLNALLDQDFQFMIFGLVSKIFKKESHLKSFLKHRFGFFEDIGYKKIEENIQQEKFGLDYYQLIKNSKISFNIHGDIAGDYACNMRMFEVTGVGSCLVTDYKKNIRDFFEPDYEIVTYSSKEEVINKIKYLLENEDYLLEIAKRGREKTLKMFNYSIQAERMIEIFKKEGIYA